MKNSNLIHLHTHNEYSLLDGVGTAEDYIKEAKELKMNSIALTNHGNVDGVIKWQKACNKENIQSIIGCEPYIVNDLYKKEKETRYHIVLLVRNKTGWKNLLKMLTIANLEGFYYKPRIDPTLLLKHCEGLTVLTACVASFLWMDKGELLLKKLLNKTEVILEVQPHLLKDQIITNKFCLKLSKKYNLPIVATNDCHYPKKDQSLHQEVLLAIQTKKTWKDKNRFKFPTDSFWLMNEEEMKDMFKLQEVLTEKQIDKAIMTTGIIAEKCKFQIKKVKVELPIPPIPELKNNDDEDEVLMNLVLEGMEEKIAKKIITGSYKKITTKYYQRIEEELDLIINLGFSRYFLIVYELINWCKDNKITTGAGRGSVGGSLVAFCLGITQVDPIKYNLVFSRFISKDRIDLPDIDMDFEDIKRKKIQKHLKDIYGKYNVAGVSTFTKMKAKGILHDVSRVFEVPLKEVLAVTKGIKDEPDKSDEKLLGKWLNKTTEGQSFKKKYPKVCEIALALEGQIRNAGQHACAMCISKKDLRIGSNCNLVNRKKTILGNWEKEDSEYMGLMKLDILGLTILTVLNETKKLIKKRHGVVINLNTIDINDPKLYKSFNTGKNTGVFQFNSNTAIKLCKESIVNNFEELVIVNALNRPSLLRSGMADAYIKRKNGEERTVYLGKEHKKITSNTFGIMIYQEQIMQMAFSMAKLPWNTAEKMRKVIAKSKGEKQLIKFKEKFIKGCVKNKTTSSKNAIKLFDDIKTFGGYGFNKAHATEYTMIAIWQMYLKTYYPIEYISGQLTFGDEKKIADYIEEAKELGLKIALPDINKSKAKKWTIDKKKNLLIPFTKIKGIGEKASKAIINERSEGRFLDYDDFENRIDSRVVNIRVRKILIDLLCFTPKGKKKVSEKKLEEISNLFDFNISNDPIYKYRNVFKKLNIVVNNHKKRIKKNAFKIKLIDNKVVLKRKNKVIHADNLLEGDTKELKTELAREIKTLPPEKLLLLKDIYKCKECDLRKECNKPLIPDIGNFNIMIVGEMPDKICDREQMNFISEAGSLLINGRPEFTKGLADLGMKREAFYLTNLVKCFAGKGSKPNKAQIKKCSKWFNKEVEMIKPYIMLALGNTSLIHFKQKETGIMNLSGTTEWNDKYNCWICYCMNPSAVLYSLEYLESYEKGIKNFVKKAISIGFNL